MRSSWLFPPRTREVQFDEKWASVAKKPKNCDPADPAVDPKGDYWDHVAYDPEHRLVLAVIPGARSIENAEAIVGEVKQRLGDALPRLITSDEYPAYESAIEATFGQPDESPRPTGPGRRPIVPKRRVPTDLAYATMHKEREGGRVVAVRKTIVLGDREQVNRALEESTCSRSINTSFVEQRHATDRGRNASKARKTYRFSEHFGSATRRVDGKREHPRWRRAWRITSGRGTSGWTSRSFNPHRTPPTIQGHTNANMAKSI